MFVVFDTAAGGEVVRTDDAVVGEDNTACCHAEVRSMVSHRAAHTPNQTTYRGKQENKREVRARKVHKTTQAADRQTAIYLWRWRNCWDWWWSRWDRRGSSSGSLCSQVQSGQSWRCTPHGKTSHTQESYNAAHPHCASYTQSRCGYLRGKNKHYARKFNMIHLYMLTPIRQ